MEQSFGPYLEIARIQSEINRMFDILLEMRQEGPESSLNSWLPSVDVCQTNEGLIVRCDLPGVSPDQVRLTALGGALIISGERLRQEPKERVKYACMERTGGKFRRVVPFTSPVNTREARAILRGGVLEVLLPRVSNRRGEEVVIPVEDVGDPQ